ncbi:MAG TPA: hypothetical protein P5142_12325, partial [Spirochaetia bacterium]|nr:hypothetical protein [Spirochaetia bacterium]
MKPIRSGGAGRGPATRRPALAGLLAALLASAGHLASSEALAPGPGAARAQGPAPSGEPWGPEGPPARSHAGAADYGLPMPWGEASFTAFR